MEASEIQLARLDERMKMILDRMEDTQRSHAHARGWMRKMDLTLHSLDARVGSVETSLAKSAPTIEEFMAIKHKVLGAGIAGRWMWVTLGALLGIMITLREHLFKFLNAS